MVPLLAPAYQADMCPHPAERWELRSRPFGCSVSSTTSLTAVVSIAATVAVAIFVLLNAVAVMRWRRYTKQTPHWRDEWRHRWRKALAPAGDGERAPLLSNSQGMPAHDP
ncbi:plexin repeat domain-containing protein [Purpureocillium lavendulum]|uniref:Plexin repeat domain-containing protein n=1 Tax=Purpureocillium lavendulum TaxID=1247861 RepID=A0AB34G422_9HYPO|nr:plexin repeat domain-containing protein [Purpureocillium lavendulum]